MDEKQIIIDGVDVAGCYFYYKGECRCEQNCIDDDKGETIEELFYREPKHNKWECELSKNCYYKQLKLKEQECEELKAKIKYMEEYIKTVENARNEFEKESNFLKEENKRLKQTLTEIKEIAETISLPMGTGKSSNRVILAKQILQKISEVKINGTNP